jgi:hypothetical protein
MFTLRIKLASALLRSLLKTEGARQAGAAKMSHVLIFLVGDTCKTYVVSGVVLSQVSNVSQKVSTLPMVKKKKFTFDLTDELYNSFTTATMLVIILTSGFSEVGRE